MFGGIKRPSSDIGQHIAERSTARNETDRRFVCLDHTLGEASGIHP
jgi:hypothetical protein